VRILVTVDPEIPVPPRFYGGIERIADSLVRELQARGHVVALAAHRDSTAPVQQLFPWPGTRSQQLWDTWRNVAAMWKAVRDFRPDVLHSFSRALYLLPLLPAGLPKIMSYQRLPGRRQVSSARVLSRGSLVFTGCSEYICREGRAGGGTWVPIHNCVSPQSYTFTKTVPADAPLVFLSRVERLKGAHVAIAVAKRAGRRLVIAGNHGDSGEDRRYWETEILPHVDKDGIEYVGPVDDRQKNALLGGAAAMLVPIQWDEPFGIVFAESLACGTPVISTPRGALPEIVRHGVDGYLVNTVAEACAAVAALSSIDRFTCRTRAEANFSTRVVVDRYEALYRRLVTPQPDPAARDRMHTRTEVQR
jgi:glycosyltransferase involved in cell wall biosynthesis